MKVLIGCARSGVLARAFRAVGVQAFECDVRESAGCPAEWFYQADLFDLIGAAPVVRDRWDMLIVHPPCQFLSVSGLHWNKRIPEREGKTRAALAFARRCFGLADRVKHFCLENPVSCISTAIRKPDQTIQPYEFGDDASKRTCLWLSNLPKLVKLPSELVRGRVVEWSRGSGRVVERWSNQCDSGQNILGPSQDRSDRRAETYPGIARAMAKQWGCL